MKSPREERRGHKRMGPLLRWYYAVKYRPFRRERRPRDERRGAVVLQIDALAYADLRRALELGYCPTIARLLHEGGFHLRRWFCGLPSATPYCQAGIFHGENAGIPAFRFYDKRARRVITCNAPHGVQYIRDRIHAPGALAGGSSYVNLLDGDASTVAFTVATRERTSVYRRLGGTRMALLIALHPIRVARMALQSAWEWLREEWERAVAQLAGRVTHAEGVFPLVRIISNVIVRELQTMAIILDVYLGVPVIYSTFMQYDELAHHFGPSSRQALGDLRRTDARIAEIWRMIQASSARRYDLIILSDHGMTPARSYRVRFGESLGSTVRRLAVEAAAGGPAPAVHASASEDSEYADIGPGIVETVADLSHRRHRRWRRMLRRTRDWVRSRYGLREIIFPEKYFVDARQELVVTYSSCLALVYFAADARQLDLDDILRAPQRAALYKALLAHPGIGLVATRRGELVHLESRAGCAVIDGGGVRVTGGQNPLDHYGTERYVVRAIRDLVRQPNAGDLVLFGAYDGYEIISFDDQVGAHGSAGGDQMYPFMITPPDLDLSEARLEDARDVHGEVMERYAAGARGA
ncbi:MAG TPA: alkaline phosphatase family protein [Gemmatimonadaceae bacterium]|nr:alkaline phosphatase family protein [Gemmatimonadaceae bacterium]